MSRLIISRKKEWLNRGRKYNIYVDGDKVETITNGEVKELDMESGNHRVQFKMDWCSSPDLEIEIPEEKSKSLEVSGFKLARWVLPLLYIIFGIYFIGKIAFQVEIKELIYAAIPLIAIMLYYLSLGRKKYLVAEVL